MRRSILKAFQIADDKARRSMLLILGLTLVGSFLEAVGISIIFPLLKLITTPEVIQSDSRLQWIYNTLGLTSTGQFIILTCVAFFFVFLFKNLFMVGFYYIQFTFAFTGTTRLADRMLRFYLSEPYENHVSRSSAELIRNIREAAHDVYSTFLVNLINLSVEIFLVLSLITVVFLIEPMATFVAGAIIAALILAYYKICGPMFERWGHERMALSHSALLCLQQSLGAFKEARVFNRMGFFLSQFREIQAREISNRRNHQMGSQLPRLINEMILLGAMLSVIIVVFVSNSAMTDVVAGLGVFAGAALRLMPAVNRVTVALHTLRGSAPAVDIVHRELRIAERGFDERHHKSFAEPEDEAAALQPSEPFQSIQFENLGFVYPNSDAAALHEINVEISAGESIGLVGASGAGKTTFADIILGLLNPSTGRVLVNGKQIGAHEGLARTKVGYVPQSIFILDDTLRNNVAFGIAPEEIDDEKVHAALRLAHLHYLVEDLPDGLDSKLKEGGQRLSGGQRQRVGIARALYDDPEVLVFDEATSALDSETEFEVNKAIQELRGRKTVIVIAHRLATVRSCNRLFFFDQGRIVGCGNFDTLFNKNEKFARLVAISGMAGSNAAPAGAEQTAIASTS